MAKLYTRKELDERLRNEIAAGRPLFMTNAGCGLTAKLQAMGGTDIIIVSPTSYWRMKGQSSINAFMPSANSVECIRSILPEISAVVDEAPLGVLYNCHNPLQDDVKILSEFKEQGVCAVNPLMVKAYGEAFNARLDSFGIGWQRELDIIKICHDLDMYTLSYAYTPEEAKILAGEGTDMIFSHLGQTIGGLLGSHAKMTLDEAVELSAAIFDAAREANPNILLMLHGGSLTTPEDVEYVYKRTNADGFVGGSAAERLPIEQSVLNATKSFKSYSR